MPHVRFDRPEPQRPVRRPVLAVGRQKRLGLNGIPQGGARAVALHQVHLGRAEPRIGQRRADHALLRRPVGRRQPVGGAVLIHRGSPQHGQHRMPQSAGIGQPLQRQHAHAFGERRAIGGTRVRLASAVGGQRSLPAEFDEHRRSGHDRHTAGQRQITLAGPQRLRRQMHRHQRRRARRVHRHRRALQAQRVRHPARGHAQGGSPQAVPFQVSRNPALAAIGAVKHPGEHAGRRAP